MVYSLPEESLTDVPMVTFLAVPSYETSVTALSEMVRQVNLRVLLVEAALKVVLELSALSVVNSLPHTFFGVICSVQRVTSQ